MTALLQLFWILLFVLLAAEVIRSSEIRLHWPWLLALFAGSLGLRVWLAPYGPGDLAPNIVPVYLDDADLLHGQAPIALLKMLRIFQDPLRDSGIFAFYILLSSLLPLLLFAILRTIDVDWRAALVACFALATHPLLVYFSAVLNRQPGSLFALFASVWGLLSFLRDGKPRFIVVFVMAAVLAGLSRPEGGPELLLLSGAFTLLYPTGIRRKGLILAAAVVLGFFDLGYLRYFVLRSFTGHAFTSTESTRSYFLAFPSLFIFRREITPLAWIVASVGGLALGSNRRMMAACWLGIVGIGFILRAGAVSPGSISNCRYETLALLPFSIGIGLLGQRILQVSGSLGVAGIASLTALALPSYATPARRVLPNFTIDEEYHFLRDSLRALPPRATIYIPEVGLEIGLIGNGDYLSRFLGAPGRIVWIQSRQDCEAVVPERGPTYVYLGSHCAPVEYRDEGKAALLHQWTASCALYREQVSTGAKVVSERDAASRPFGGARYLEPAVHLALYEIHQRLPCDRLYPRGYESMFQ